ncbi:MAG: RNA polymerase sigma factor [Oscillospiraceae bacterium]|nr:RNA polymerase sigma factor [Oscillospiraceae bacterium]
MDRIKVSQYIEETAKTVFSYCLARTNSKEEAEDLSQDILLEILKSACNLRDDKAFYNFMWAVANNVYKNWCKKKARRKQTFYELDENLPDDNVDLDNLLILSDEVNLLRRELSLLSEKYRIAAVLYYSKDYSVSKVAKTLSISENMVKYLLFKARKILKEGIGMEREFGEKSYNPGKFEYNVIYDGMANDEYRNLFARKIPGNILLSAYYTPMTVRELSIEMGISSVYMEDEIALLERYDLIKSVGECKYQTNIIIFTEDFMKEWYKMADKNYVSKIGEVIGLIKDALPEIRKIGFRGCDLPENNLLWTFYILTLFHGSGNYHDRYKEQNFSRTKLYRDETGTIYGKNYDGDKDPYRCFGFGGTCGWEDICYNCSFADFDVLSYHILENYGEIKNIMLESVNNRDAAKFPVFNGKDVLDTDSRPDNDYAKTIELLQPAINKMGDIFKEIADATCKIMSGHAPKFLAENIKPIVYNVLPFSMIGWYGAAAVNSGALKKPESNDIVSICGYIG